jgi:hypothetical protein
VRDTAGALIAGQRDPRTLAGLARGRMKAKRAALIEATAGRIRRPPPRAGRHLAGPDRRPHRADRRPRRQHRELIAAIPGAQGAGADGTTGPQAGRGPDAAVLPATGRLQEIPGHLPARRPGHHRRDRPGA